MIAFEVLGDPIAKARPRFTRGGHVYTATSTRVAEGQVYMEATKAMDGNTPMLGPLFVFVVAHLAIPKSWSKKRQQMADMRLIHPDKRPDLDNLVKLVTDGMNGVCYEDDKQIVFMQAGKVYDRRVYTEVCVGLYDDNFFPPFENANELGGVN